MPGVAADRDIRLHNVLRLTLARWSRAGPGASQDAAPAHVTRGNVELHHMQTEEIRESTQTNRPSGIYATLLI